MNKKWEYYESNEELINEISEKFNINKIIAKILLNRGITDIEKIKVFLEPNRSNFYDPYLINDMEIAINRIIKAIENKEKVIIYGDYDVDGITSTTVLKKFLEERGLETGYYIPDRLDEGYGLNMNAMDYIANEKYTLMITVDCGISGIEEVDYIKKLGVDVIITDHHEPLEELPKALAVIDSKRKDNTYPFNQLAGVGVVFKVIQAISIKLGLDEKEYLKYLDLVCVGTISDIVPLVDENRVIAKLGLMLVNVTKNIGLKTLLKASGFTTCDENTVSFGIAPRINACGRMGNAIEALELLLTEDSKKAEELTYRLNEYNRQRQEIEKNIFKEAMEQIEGEKQNDVIVVGHENWHHGVIGIVASKITEIYFKPSILLCFEDGIAKGSGRSVPGFDLHGSLCMCSSLLEKYGGHAMAVGLTLNQNNLKAFKNKLEEIAKENKVNEIVPVIYIDAQITNTDFNVDFVKQIKQLQPFGESNKVPVFIYKNLKIDSIRTLTEGKHLKLTLKDDNTIINAIGFNMGHLGNEFLIGDKVDVVGNIEINSFNGKDTVQINIKDIMKSI